MRKNKNEKMKRIVIGTACFLSPLALVAQDGLRLPDGSSFSQQLVEIPATLIAVYLISWFLLSIIRGNLDYRLKSKMIDKGVNDKIAEQFLQPTQKDTRSQTMKYFLLLAGAGLGLTIVSYTLPLGIHSLAIMVFSLSLSFLGYYFFMKRLNK
jgi:hypothetical protein